MSRKAKGKKMKNKQTVSINRFVVRMCITGVTDAPYGEDRELQTIELSSMTVTGVNMKTTVENVVKGALAKAARLLDN